METIRQVTLFIESTEGDMQELHKLDICWSFYFSLSLHIPSSSARTYLHTSPLSFLPSLSSLPALLTPTLMLPTAVGSHPPAVSPERCLTHTNESLGEEERGGGGGQSGRLSSTREGW